MDQAKSKIKKKISIQLKPQYFFEISSQHGLITRIVTGTRGFFKTHQMGQRSMEFDHSVCDKGSLWRDPVESMELSSCQSRDPQSQAAESADHRSLW